MVIELYQQFLFTPLLFNALDGYEGDVSVIFFSLRINVSLRLVYFDSKVRSVCIKVLFTFKIMKMLMDASVNSKMQG